MAFRNAFVAASAVASAYAQTSSCGSSGSTTTISNAAGVSSIAACSTYSGSVVIQSGAPGATLDFGSTLKKINGDLTYENDAGVTSIQGSGLQNVGDFTLNNLTGVATLNFPNMATVGNIDFEGLGGLGQLTFGSLQSANNVTIINTNLASISGITSAPSIAGLSVSNNQFLSSISSNLGSIATLIIGANDVSNGGFSLSFPNLTTAQFIQIQNTTTASFPLLQNVTQELGIYNSNFQTFAINNLTTLGALYVQDNAQLTNLSLPALTATTNGPITVSGNPNWLVLSLPVISKINGGFNIQGAFLNVTVPDLKTISGSSNVTSSQPSFDCTTFTNYAMNQISIGTSYCAAGVGNSTSSASGSATSGSTGPSGTSSSGSGSGSGSSGKSAGSMVALPLFTVASVVAGALSYLLL